MAPAAAVFVRFLVRFLLLLYSCCAIWYVLLMFWRVLLHLFFLFADQEEKGPERSVCAAQVGLRGLPPRIRSVREMSCFRSIVIHFCSCVLPTSTRVSSPPRDQIHLVKVFDNKLFVTYCNTV
jgi:hypothetical protein